MNRMIVGKIRGNMLFFGKIKHLFDKFLRKALGRKYRIVSKRLSFFWEYIISLGGYSERLLLGILLRVYKSHFRMQWVYSHRPPHFEDQRIDIAFFAFGDEVIGPYSFYRGFLSSEVIHHGDCLLDIGCGDGFFTRRFFAEKCAHIDAVDIDSDAICIAQMNNSAPNIKYHLLDAVNQPFPHEQYDVVVWDGAIAHFPQEVTHNMLSKIQQVLTPGGIFVGSESLMEEGGDHLQVFLSLEDLGRLFKPYFKYIELRSTKYKNIHADSIREEAYWRCTNDDKRLLETRWRQF